ncbi:hypothetical protein [Nocardioides sp. B-3]|uniref:hypothetical protein n=1 Tax=Nocardioides sp. B-3 TaxID=2895565 RepID=UPI0021531B7C|nr:hypothetical protein [Nocardioides sp. B-3]UUZ61301.1 hypothetical protein LP418_12340 [Nocardioides sp. B-3]
MTQSDPQFRVVLRGYEPAQVDRRLAELAERLAAAEQNTAAYAERVQLLEQHAAEGANREAEPVAPPTFAHLGERIAQMLTLAEVEAGAVRARGRPRRREPPQAGRAVDHRNPRRGRPVCRPAAPRRRRRERSRPDRRPARGRRDPRRGRARRRRAPPEAEAIYEEQRANAARAAADFETTLAQRRERTAAEFREQQGATQLQLETMASRVEEMRTAAEAEREAADTESRRVLADAQSRATAIVREARANAERIRSDSERELAAATQRRDSINEQLVNVRQMLTTLSGSAAGMLAEEPAPVAAAADEAPVADEPVDEVDEGDDVEQQS